MARKHASDSITAKITEATFKQPEYEVPDALESLTDGEQRAWDSYICSKSVWNSSELRTLHKLVKLETKCDLLRAESDETPSMYMTPAEIPKPHPIHEEYRKCLNLCATIYRLIGFDKGRSSGERGKRRVEGGKVSTLFK